MKNAIQSKNAPEAIGCYSQAIQAGNTVYLSGQIPLDPTTMMLVSGIHSQINRVFENLKAVVTAAGGQLDQIVKLTVYLTDMNALKILNDVMPNFFQAPYPARTTIAVSALPKNALVEVEAILVL